jgi:streptogramin lyase
MPVSLTGAQPRTFAGYTWVVAYRTIATWHRFDVDRSLSSGNIAHRFDESADGEIGGVAVPRYVCLSAALALAGVVPQCSASTASTQRMPRLRVTATVTIGGAPTGLTWGVGSIWVANYGDGTVDRVDPERNRVTARVDLHASPYDVAFGAESVWASSFDSSAVTRIDPKSNAVVARIDIGGSEQARIVATASGVWVAV